MWRISDMWRILDFLLYININIYKGTIFQRGTGLENIYIFLSCPVGETYLEMAGQQMCIGMLGL